MSGNKRGSMDMSGGMSGLNVSLRGLFQPQQPQNGNGENSNRRRSVAAGGGGGFFDRSSESLNLEDALAAAGRDMPAAASFHRTKSNKASSSTRRMSMPASAASRTPMYHADLKNNEHSRCAGDDSPTSRRRNSSGLAGVAQLLLPQLRRSSMQSGGGGGGGTTARRRSSMFSSMGSVDAGIPEDAPALDERHQHDDDPYHREDDPYGDPYHRGDSNGEGEGFVCVEEERLRGIYDKIHVLRTQQDAELRRKDLTVDALAHENATLHKRLEVLLADADDRHTVSEYAKLITSTMPPPHVADSNYALNLQTQLCRALKKMGTLEERLREATECSANGESDPRITELQSKLAEMDGESFRSDLDRSKDLISMEMEMERERNENELCLAEKEREIEAMMERLELEREAHRRTREALSGADDENTNKVGGGAPPLLPPSSAVNRPFMENHAA